MTVKQWFDDGCDYAVGLALYGSLPNHNRHFLVAIRTKNSKQNLYKLKYELKKFLKNDASVSVSIVQNEVQQQQKITAVPDTKFYKKVFIKDLPVELHSVYIQQKSAFSLACSLKIQLNKLQEHEREHKALPLLIRIHSLFKTVDTSWEIIDYYLEHKVIPVIKSSDFSNLTAVQLLNKQTSLRSSITRQKKRLKMLQEKFNGSVVKANKTKYKMLIDKCNNKLLQLNNDLTEVEGLVGGC